MAIAQGAILRGAIFLGGNYPRGNNPEGNHPGAIIRKAIIQREIVRKAIIQEAIFLGGNCPGAIIQGAIFLGAIILRSNCPGAIIREVIIQGPVIQGTIFLRGNCPDTLLQLLTLITSWRIVILNCNIRLSMPLKIYMSRWPSCFFPKLYFHNKIYHGVLKSCKFLIQLFSKKSISVYLQVLLKRFVRGSLPEEFSQNLSKFTWKILCQSLFFNKATGFRRTFFAFVLEHLRRLLLICPEAYLGPNQTSNNFNQSFFRN